MKEKEKKKNRKTQKPVKKKREWEDLHDLNRK